MSDRAAEISLFSQMAGGSGVLDRLPSMGSDDDANNNNRMSASSRKGGSGRNNVDTSVQGTKDSAAIFAQAVAQAQDNGGGSFAVTSSGNQQAVAGVAAAASSSGSFFVSRNKGGGAVDGVDSMAVNANLQAAAEAFRGEEEEHRQRRQSQTKTSSSSMQQSLPRYTIFPDDPRLIPSNAVMGTAHLFATSPRSEASSLMGGHGAVHREPIGMHSERVLLPRPLFFGPLIPPRVIQECRERVKEVMVEKQLSNTDVRLSDLPPSLRNLCGCVQTFGYGVSPFPTLDDDDDDKHDAEHHHKIPDDDDDELEYDKERRRNEEKQWRIQQELGNPYVETYQPVWGEATRAERETTRKRRRMQRMSMEKATSTGSIGLSDVISSDIDWAVAAAAAEAAAAAGSSSSTMGDGFTTANMTTTTAATSDSAETDVAGGISPASPPHIPPPPPLPQTDTATFAEWLRNADASSTGGSDMMMGGSSSNMNHESSFGGGGASVVSADGDGRERLGSTASVDTSENKSQGSSTAEPIMTDTNLFAQWARGEVAVDASSSLPSPLGSPRGTSLKRAVLSKSQSVGSTSPASDANTSFGGGWGRSPTAAVAGMDSLLTRSSANNNTAPATNSKLMSKPRLTKASTVGGEGGSGNGNGSGSVSPMTDKNLFAQWARGENTMTSPSAALGSPRMITSSRGNTPRATSNGSVVSNSGGVTAVPPSLFAQWAQHGGDSGVTNAGGSISLPATGSATNHESSQATTPKHNIDKNLFSQWARAGADAIGGGAGTSGGGSDDGSRASGGSTTGTSPAQQVLSPDSNESEKDQFSKWALAGAMPSSDQGQENDGSNNNLSTGGLNSTAADSSLTRATSFTSASSAGGIMMNPSDTFRHVDPINDDSDDDSVVGSEMKKKVGMNEHLNAALASLANDTKSPSGRTEASMASSESITAMDSNALLWQLGQTTPGGRALSNLELTGGCVPLFACDDPSLPVEADLGIYETKEDQLRNIEVQRSQEIVDKHANPNIFGSISCPNPALGPDDNHSWNSRSFPLGKSSTGAVQSTSAIPGSNNNVGPGLLPVPESHLSRGRRTMRSPSPTARRDDEPSIMPPPVPMRHVRSAPSGEISSGRHPAASETSSLESKSTKKKKKRVFHRIGPSVRYGWWNSTDDDETDEKAAGAGDSTLQGKVEGMPVVGGMNGNVRTGTGPVEQQQQLPLQLPPTEHSADALLVNTRLSPTPAKLREENFPLSHLHAATSVASSLPFLSDRPPSWRYLQIETKAVGFPPVGGEIEPFFCSLAIYHVETQTNLTGGPRSAPLPNLQRCGRVTEVLNFDVVTDEDVEARCRDTLWPLLQGRTEPEAKDRTQGTRCGVFPIPSNLTVANLYAIIIVHKVLSDESDVEAYINKDSMDKKSKGMTPPRNSVPIPVDLEKYRTKAERASSSHGRLLMQFAFGVAPLLQVFGADTPSSSGYPSSRGVQVPLFRLSPGQGEKSIYHHIMVMLYPRADHRAAGINGPAPLTNGGSAVLVMRNFGYLGLQSAVDARSSLARHRLIDFTGELQIRQRIETDPDHSYKLNPSDRDYVVAPWRPQFISEPTKYGGRNIVEIRKSIQGSKDGKNPEGKERNRDKLYAQELAPVPLQITGSFGSIGRSPINSGSPARPPRSGHQAQSLDCEPSFHSGFYNEMLCSPRLLRSSPKKTITIKVELRELEWSQALDGYIAYPLSDGPCIHNSRRGPNLVPDAYTACVPGSSTASFMDEFKMKLPLLLQRFASSDGQIGRRVVVLFSAYKISMGKSTWKSWFGGKNSGDSVVSGNSTEHTTARMKFIACGFLNVTGDGDSGCLIENGLHDIRMMYSVESSEDLEDSFVLRRMKPSKSSTNSHSKSDSSGSGGDRVFADAEEASLMESESAISESRNSEGIMAETATTVSGISKDSSGHKGYNDMMSLQVRVLIHSSLHAQSSTLSEFLQSVPDPPRPLISNEVDEEWKKGRDNLLALVRKESQAMARAIADESNGVLAIAASDLCNPGACPPSMITSHFFRIISQLIGLMVAGPGDPSITWANPATLIPLRVQAFSSLLQLLCSAGAFLSKNGVTQLDGKHKWNTMTLAHLVSLVFNERVLFSETIVEPFELTSWTSKRPMESPSKPKREVKTEKVQKPKPKLRRRHTRSDSDNLIMSSASMAVGLESEGDFPLSSSMTLPGNISKQLSTMKASQTSGTDDSELLSSSRQASLEQDGFRLDSKADFQSALIAGGAFSDGFSLGGGATNNRRKFNTLPPSALATIREDLESNDIEEKPALPKRKKTPPGTSDTELVFHERKPTKQFRRPKINRAPSDDREKSQSGTASSTRSDEDIESAGTAFLDVVGKNLGYGKVQLSSGKNGAEEKRVGHAHHRKTMSRSSVDWSLPNLNAVGAEIENEFSSPISMGKNEPTTGDDEDDATEFKSELDMSMTALKEETYNEQELPNYLDRLALIAAGQGNGNRWYPFVYEVIIFQWASLLSEQRKNGDKRISGMMEFEGNQYPRGYNMDGGGSLREAAGRVRGVTITSAPILFELIKKSLGYRLHHLLRVVDERSRNHPVTIPPVIKLDENILSCLEYLVTAVTDACLDSRNFDSWDFRQTSIDVNDSLVRFLRDMFAFLSPETVHRLILIYFSRYVIKEGKRSQDKDSKIALRCSWEICKLRLNAVTTLMRVRDFVRINSPQMLNWGAWPLSAPSHVTRQFFNNSVRMFLDLQMQKFTGSEPLAPGTKFEIPQMKPHWLAEIATDICLSGAEHPDPYIQHRAASLLHELFWAHSGDGRASGSSSVVASMYITFLGKVLKQASYLSMLSPQGQLRKDILPCVVFILQCAPVGLLRGVWRTLCLRAEGRGQDEKNFGLNSSQKAVFAPIPKIPNMEDSVEPDIYDMFSLLNLALGTFEYEGCDDNVEHESGSEEIDQVSVWQKEYLTGLEENPNHIKARRLVRLYRRTSEEALRKQEPKHKYSTTSSRKWFSHDGSIVIINTCRYIVREMLFMSTLAEENPSAKRQDRSSSRGSRFSDGLKSINSFAETILPDALHFSDEDSVLFVRAATSVYLHALSSKQSDIVTVKTLIASIETVKIFGVKVFFEAVGETFQHWMRTVLFCCGARRADVRVQALEFLALVLRVTWDSYGSFSRVRVPLLAIQNEVMERHVSIATSRFFREQRRLSMTIQSLTNDSAEACLAPLWRSLDRLHHQSASQNVAFRSALVRLAEMMKKIYRAYIAVNALSILHRKRNNAATAKEEEENIEVAALLQSRRISVHRIIMASAGFCKRFLGPKNAASLSATVAHNEAVEDAFLDAAIVFSATELPLLRVAWLHKLADFHKSRGKFAEEATCRFRIHATYRQSLSLHGSLWTSIPFLPWANDNNAAIHLEYGEPGDLLDGDFQYDDPLDVFHEHGKQIDKTDSFRRMFYRVANSVRFGTRDLEVGGNRNLFYGVTFASEYRPTSPWHSMREIEGLMMEEAESAAELYMRAGITESSRFTWGLATQFYAEKFNYAKLSYSYMRLATVLSSQVPIVDTTDQALELSHPLGRFFRVWFHGGAPDDLIGAEFVYRAGASVKLEAFGKYLTGVIQSILPDNTPIDLVLDDGRMEEPRRNHRKPLGLGNLEPVKLKITPLRPLVQSTNNVLRGTPEWFHRYTDETFSSGKTKKEEKPRPTVSVLMRGNGGGAHFSHRPSMHSRSFSSSMFQSGDSGSSRQTDPQDSVPLDGFDLNSRQSGLPLSKDDLVGVDRFSFLQAVRRDRHRSSRDWLKTSTDFAGKSLRVTVLQVSRTFPASVSRQTVSTRTVFTQSPLEAGLDAVCTWCSVLFRTAVATKGLKVLGEHHDSQGLGSAATKVVADCLHNSRVKEMGLLLLKKNTYIENVRVDGTNMFDYARLSEEEINCLQAKLARGILVFLEILHLLISRNRDLLLAVVERRKRADSESYLNSATASIPRNASRENLHTIGSPVGAGRRNSTRGAAETSRSSTPVHIRGVSGVSSLSHQRGPSSDSVPTHGRNITYLSSSDAVEGHRILTPQTRDRYHPVPVPTKEKTDSNIAIQSELQRTFVSMCKALYPLISNVLHSNTPKWMKQAASENYFSAYTYRQTKVNMADELNMVDEIGAEDDDHSQGGHSFSSSVGNSMSYSRGHPDSPSDSYTGSIRSRGSRPRDTDELPAYRGPIPPLHTANNH